jgi:hypothetical protein
VLCHGDSAVDARAQVEWVRTHDAEAQAIAALLHRRVSAEHSASKFWGDVLA